MEIAIRSGSFYSNYGHCRPVNEKRSAKIFVAKRRADKRCVAVKMEKVSRKRRAGKNKPGASSLEHEHSVYKHLCGRGVPKVQWFGTVDECKALVMDLTGPALEELFTYCNRRFSLKTVLMLADQMFDRIQCLHDAGYIHADITPDNFVMGIEKNVNKVYLVNMKWAFQYVKKNGQHIPYRENVEFYGSPCFASLNRHLGTVSSRRDDLESCVYVILYFLKGTLPWQLDGDSRNILERILEIKTTISSEALCNGLPVQFVMILNYCRALKFDAEPDYLFIRQLLRSLSESLAYEEDWDFDWIAHYYTQRQLRRT